MSTTLPTLQELADNTRTDKNTNHSYLELYNDLLSSRRFTAKNVLEIGIGPALHYPCVINGYTLESNGGSIKLWNDFFIHANIYALDIIHYSQVWDGIKNNDSIKLYTSQNAYDSNFVLNEFKSTKFDFIIDDGPHTLESMILCVQLYLPLLNDNGILIIEDLQQIEWLNILKSIVPDELKQYVTFYDRRNIKGRYDDIVFVIDKKN